MKQLRGLKHPLHFLTRSHLALVAAAFDPDRPVIVHVRLAQAFRDRYDDDNAPGNRDVFRHGVDRRSDTVRRRIGYELVQPPNTRRVVRLKGSII